MTLKTVELHTLFDKKFKIYHGRGFFMFALEFEGERMLNRPKLNLNVYDIWGSAHWIYLPVHRVKNEIFCYYFILLLFCFKCS